jgi:hypothetical protein
MGYLVPFKVLQKEAGDKRAEGVIGVSLRADLAGPKPDEGCFPGNRQNLFE